MASRSDTLKLGRLDLVEAADKLQQAQRRLEGYGVTWERPEDYAARALRLIDRTAARLRKSFGLNGREAA